LLSGHGDERIQRPVEALDALEEVACQLRCGDASRPEITG
jgi:hypothetical protein